MPQNRVKMAFFMYTFSEISEINFENDQISKMYNMAGGYAKNWFGLNGNFDFNCNFLCFTICVHFEFLATYCKKQKLSIQPPPGNELKAKLYDTPLFGKDRLTERREGLILHILLGP
jgi:hypothetical protein